MRLNETWTPEVIQKIRAYSETGNYAVKCFGARRKVAHFEDLVFVQANVTRLAIEQYREPCSTKTILGHRYCKKPLELDLPVVIAAMSFGALSKNAKIALAKGSAMAGSAASTGEGGMLPEERENAKNLFYQCTPSRFGFSPHSLQQADVIEILLSQGAKPGVGGHLMGKKVTDEISKIRGIPKGFDLRSPSRHPDVLGADDLVLKVEELREAMDSRIPVSVKQSAGRVREDVKLAVKVKADIIALDGFQGGTGGTPELTQDNLGIPTIAAIPAAYETLRELKVDEDVDILAMGGIRGGADVAKALALGAKCCAIGTAAMVALGCVGCMRCHTGLCPKGIATQDPALVANLDIDEGAEKVANLLRAIKVELEMITRACGKTNCHNLEFEDLRAITLEAAAMTGVPMVGPASKVEK